LMAHLQLRRQDSGERVLPVYYSDNYVSFTPGETRTLTIEAAQADLQGQTPLVVLDGWNVLIKPAATASAALAPNVEAQPGHWPTTGLPFQPQ